MFSICRTHVLNFFIFNRKYFTHIRSHYHCLVFCRHFFDTICWLIALMGRRSNDKKYTDYQKQVTIAQPLLVRVTKWFRPLFLRDMGFRAQFPYFRPGVNNSIIPPPPFVTTTRLISILPRAVPI